MIPRVRAALTQWIQPVAAPRAPFPPLPMARGDQSPSSQTTQQHPEQNPKHSQERVRPEKPKLPEPLDASGKPHWAQLLFMIRDTTREWLKRMNRQRKPGDVYRRSRETSRSKGKIVDKRAA